MAVALFRSRCQRSNHGLSASLQGPVRVMLAHTQDQREWQGREGIVFGRNSVTSVTVVPLQIDHRATDAAFLQASDNKGWLDDVQQRRQNTAEGYLATHSTRANSVSSQLLNLAE